MPEPAVSASTSSLLLDQLFNTGSSSSSLTRDLTDVSSWRKPVHPCHTSDRDCQPACSDMALLQRSKVAACMGCEPGCGMPGEETVLGDSHRCSQLSGFLGLQSPAQRVWRPPWQVRRKGQRTTADTVASSRTPGEKPRGNPDLPLPRKASQHFSEAHLLHVLGLKIQPLSCTCEQRLNPSCHHP